MPFSSRCNLRSSLRCVLRPSPALYSQPPRKINTKAPPHTPLRAHITQAHPSQYTRRGTRARARRSTPRSTSSPTSSSPGTPTHRRCAPGPAGSHARCFRSALPLCAHARDRCTCCRCTAPAPTMCPPRGAPASARDATCARHRHVRTRRIACFADGLRVAPPVQAAAAASGRARRHARPRHLRHDRQAQCRQHGHEIRMTSRRHARREACACEPVPV